MDKRNLIIAVLAGLLVLGSLWGQVGNKNSKLLRRELAQVEEKLASVEAATSQAHDEVLTKTAEAQKNLQVKGEQLAKARKELVTLRKANKGLEARLSERDITVQKLLGEKERLEVKSKSSTIQYVGDLQKKLTALKNKLTALQKELKKKDEQLAGKQGNAGMQQKKELIALQDELNEKKEQLNRVRSFAKEQAAELEKKVTALQEALKAKDAQLAQVKVGKQQLKETTAKTGQEVAELQEKLAATEAANQELAEAVKQAEKMQQVQAATIRKLETAEAQIIGLEKIIEEKNAVIEEISRTLDRVKINMDVLLNKIADQQDGLQEIQEENRALIKELAAKNKELADLQEQLQAAPIQ